MNLLINFSLFTVPFLLTCEGPLCFYSPLHKAATKKHLHHPVSVFPLRMKVN